MEESLLLQKLTALPRDEFDDLCFWLGVPRASWPCLTTSPEDRTHHLVTWLRHRDRLPDLLAELIYRDKGIFPWIQPEGL